MKKIKKILKVFSIVVAVFLTASILSCVVYYHAVTWSANLDTEALEQSKSTSIQIFDRNGEILNLTNENYISINSLSRETIFAFICAEDKRFYSHSGVDYIRIGGAILNNLKSHSFSEGASTISQQLIKNTQLSNKKTISRKLKELKITKQLEKQYSKNEILELYLNNIYFGSGCYGIENASLHYFSKSASDLTLDESALLAGIINAPTLYNPQTNPENAKSRRNLILNLMKNYGKISESQCDSAKEKPISLKITNLSNNNILYDEILKEVCSVTKMSENEIKNKNLKVKTYLDINLEQKLSEKIKEKYQSVESEPNVASIVAENETGGIVAIAGDIKSLLTKRQPGSVIKPIIVYGPAIENNIISPASILLDEKINISGYSPENADKKFHGKVSAKEALSKSYNIPAVKLLNEIGVENAQKFAKKFDIEFENSDNHLAIALGGMTNGIEPKKICEAYTSFACGGNYKSYKFIKNIYEGEKNIYSATTSSKQVMKDSTAYLITDMLKQTSKTGTARRLKDFDFEIASKTGTVGLDSSTKNSDAYNVSYTTKHTIMSYFGGTTMPESINGATYPTILTKDILSFLYSTSSPENFSVPNSVTQLSVDKNDYENGTLSITDADGLKFYFAKDNLPKQTKSTKPSNISVFNFENKKPIISFELAENYDFKIFRVNEKDEEIISSSDDLKNQKTIKFEDKTAKNGQIYEYFVEFCEKSTGEKIKSNTIKLKVF